MTRHHARNGKSTITRKQSLAAAGAIVALTLGTILWSSMPADKGTDKAGQHISTLDGQAAEKVVQRNPDADTEKTTISTAPSGSGEKRRSQDVPAVRQTDASEKKEERGQRDDAQRQIGINASEAARARVPQDTREPVGLGAKSRITSSISARISKIQAVQGEARGIGEVAGPAVKFTATLVNNSNAAISTKYTTVTLNYGNSKHPATALSGPGVKPFPQKIKPGEAGSATFVYAVPNRQREHVRFHVNYKANQPIAVFSGTAPSTGKRP